MASGVRGNGVKRKGVWWRAVAVAVAIAAPARAQFVLPPPSGQPQAIDFAGDPLLRFVHAADAPQPFLDAVGHAVERHPAVAAAIADQQATQAIRTQVRAGLFPHVDVQLLGQRALARSFADRTAVVESLQPKARSDAVVTGDQLLFDFGATGNRIAAADDRITAARADIDRVAVDTAIRAVAAWYDVLAYQTLTDLGDAILARQRAILADVRDRARQGVGPAGDIARTEAVVADSEAERSRYERLLGSARSRYQEAFGTDPAPRLTRTVPPPSTAASLVAAQGLAHQTPAVKAALARAEAARRDARAARADGLPRLSAAINGSRYSVFTGGDYEVRGTMVLRQSLFAGGRQRGIIDEAAARQRSAAFTADRIAGEGERDAAIAFTDLAALTRTAVSLETAYVANRRARDTYVEQFRVSRGSLIELLRAERDYFNAATALLQGVTEADVARYTLLARTGELLPAIGVVLQTSVTG